MTTQLTDYSVIQSNLFITISIDEYKANSESVPTGKVLSFSDRLEHITINSIDYVGLGSLLGVTDSSTELQATGTQLTISLSGIPNSAISEIVNSKIKGCPVKIMRGFFDATANTLLPLPTNPLIKFIGYVDNYSLEEEWHYETRSSSNTLVITCSNKSDMLSKKVVGRKTNSASMKKYYPNDISFDKVSVLSKSYFDFGKKL
jgi:hypothetical protein